MEGYLAVILLYFSQQTDARKCKLEEGFAVNDLNGDEYSCPGDKYSESFTECCGEGACCSLIGTNSMDEKLLRIISLTVIVSCLSITAVLLLCCFWARCPLYSACRSNYNSSDVAVFAYAPDDDPLCLMPKEFNGSLKYTPCKVTTRTLEDV